jgi:hypothetical protein
VAPALEPVFAKLWAAYSRQALAVGSSAALGYSRDRIHHAPSIARATPVWSSRPPFREGVAFFGSRSDVWQNVGFAVRRHGDRSRHGKHRRLRERRDIVLNEPSAVAIVSVKGKRQFLAAGEEAKLMVGRTPGNIKRSGRCATASSPISR